MLSNVFRISKIYIENFKNIERALLEFDDQMITILDGPNGFGKTTIFDAIELLLTGYIRRVNQLKINVGNKGFDDYLLAKDQSKPIILKIKLDVINSESITVDTIILGRKIDPGSLNRSKKKPQDFDFSVHLLSDFGESLTNSNEISQKEFEEKIGISDLVSKFRLYHYIEQEEATHLFKKNEKERMEAISKLFNIEKEVKERDILDTARRRLISYKNSLDRKMNEISKFSEIDSHIEYPEVEFFQLINIPNNNIVWDQKIIKPLDNENKTMYIEQLETIKRFINNFDEFKKELKNEKIRSIASRDERLAALIVLGHYKDELNQIKKEYNLKKKFEEIKKNIGDKRIFSSEVNWDLVYDHFNISISKEGLIQKLDYINKLKAFSSNLSNLIGKLLSTRKDLVLQYEEYVNYKNINGNECPLCGSEWATYQDLIKQIENKTETLKSELDNSTANMISEINNLYDTHLTKLFNDLEEFIKQSIDDDFYHQLNQFIHLNVNIDKAIKIFSDLDIDISIFFNREKKFVKNLDEKVNQIKEKLYSKLSNTNLELDRFKEYKQIYREIFNNNEDLLKSIDEEKINKKKQYIEYMYYMQANELFKRQQKLKKIYEKVDKYLKLISDAIKIYNEKINGHNAKVIREIEIPFYIYSGKIIQNHQRGIGVFIKEESNEKNGEPQLKAINFVPPEKTDHDIIHSFSSGQLSATVIAFSLALNKVYNNSGLRTILIDDPVQTMDEINMASLVELLRNDFSDRQIILSTHEDKISMYIRYKFSKYNYKTGNINVKEKFY